MAFYSCKVLSSNKKNLFDFTFNINQVESIRPYIGEDKLPCDDKTEVNLISGASVVVNTNYLFLVNILHKNGRN